MKKTFTILSIEDNEPDFVLLEKALNTITDVTLNIINISNGREALDFIYKINVHQNAPTPDIIILDINLPYISGKEILKKIKEDEKYKKIPVIMLSSSSHTVDIEDAYNLHANSYIIKSFDIKNLFKKISDTGKYWLKTSELPAINYFIKKNDKE